MCNTMHGQAGDSTRSVLRGQRAISGISSQESYYLYGGLLKSSFKLLMRVAYNEYQHVLVTWSAVYLL